MTQYESNLGTTERWLSLLGGIGLLLTTRRGGGIGRMARGALGFRCWLAVRPGIAW